MDEPISAKNPSNDPPNNDERSADSETVNVRVFDITPDLNISPVKEDSDNQPELPEASVKIAEPPVIDKAAPVQQPISHEREFGPANPPAKTISNPNASSPGQEVGNLSKTEKNASDNKDASDPNVKHLRTYETDIAELMSKKRLSRASIAIAEDKKKEEAVKNIAENVKGSAVQNKDVNIKKTEFVRNAFLIVFSLILIGGGLYAAYYLYSLSPVAPIKVQPSPVSLLPQLPAAIIPTDSQVALSIDSLNKTAIESAIRAEIAKPQNASSIKEIAPILQSNQVTDSSNIQNKTIVKIPANIMLGLLNMGVPDIISRSITPPWMLGVFTDNRGEKSVFVVITNNFFQNAFAGMLQWENTMPGDINTGFTLRGQFVDRIVKNKDVREYVNDNGQILFLYSFISNDKLVITNSEAALTEVVTRLERQNSIR